MKISILCGTPDKSHAAFDEEINRLTAALRAEDHEVTQVQLRTLNIKDCIGCYNCWLKTPGRCVIQDDMESVLRAYVQSDKVILATPVLIGFVSPLIKRISDRSLPLIHPYLKLEGDRMRHVSRYEKLAEQIIIVDTLEDTEAIKAVYKIGAGGSARLLSVQNGVEVLKNEITHY